MGTHSTSTRSSLTAISWAMVIASLCLSAAPVSAADIVRLDTKAVADKPGRYPAAMIGTDTSSFDGSYLELGQYATANRIFHVALWESGPGTLVTDSYPNDEYCLVLEGELTIINQNGSRIEFKPGDTFVIPKGWAGTWRMTTRFKKQFVAFRPQ